MAQIELTDVEKQEIDDNIDRVVNLQWEVGQYTFYDFVDHFELPHIVNVKRNIKTNVPDDKYLLLHSAFDRYVIIARTCTESANALRDEHSHSPTHYLLSDWCNCLCQIVSPKPVLKTRWWVFQRAFELLRFEFPRSIKILSVLPVHRRSRANPNDPWQKVVLNKNVSLIATGKCSYQSVLPNGELSSAKEGIILKDKSDNEYIIPPAVPLHFATAIRIEEMQSGYTEHHGEFNLSEVIMRYEFPIKVRLSLQPHQHPKDIELTSFCVAKSVLGVSFGKRGQAELIELSPDKGFLLHCHRSLTVGLPREDDIEMDEASNQVDNAETSRYLEVLSKLNMKLSGPVNLYKEQIRAATDTEVASINKAYQISVEMERETSSKDSAKPVYMDVTTAIKYMQTPQEQEGVPFDQAQPENFTVHICPDLTNPYKEEISYELVDEEQQPGSNADVQQTTQPSATTNTAQSTDSNRQQQQQHQQRLCETVVMQSEDIEPIPREVFAQTVKDIPDTLILVSGTN